MRKKTLAVLTALNADYFSSLPLESRGVTTTAVDAPGDRSARTYVDFADADLLDPDSKRTRVNAMSNAKRALHFQVDLLADALGFKQSPFKRKNSFPEKLDFCGKCGVVAPRILGKLNKLRNSLEHEYYMPARSESEDFLDVVTLFLHATDRLLEHFPCSVDLQTPDLFPDSCAHRIWLNAQIEPGSGTLELTLHQLAMGRKRFRALAAIEEKRLRDDPKIVSRHTDFSIRDQAYTAVRLAHVEISSIVLTASQGEPYCKWLSVIVSSCV